MNTAIPSASVLLPVYNGERYLAEAMESVLAQTFADFEFVIVDDGSTDGSPDILARYAKQDARVRIFRQQNVGRAESLNRAIGHSTGDLLARMDADDISLPERIEKQFRFLSEHPAVGLLAGGVELITTDRRTIQVACPPLTDEGIRSLMAEGNPIYPLVMMRRSAVMAAGGYRKALCDADDYDLYIRIGEHSEFAALPDTILRYRIHPDQISLRKPEHQVECALAARAAAERRRKGETDPLWKADDVTPEILRELGVLPEELRKTIMWVRMHWMDLVADFYPETALEIKDKLLSMCSSKSADRKTAAQVLFKAASIHRRERDFGKALSALGRAVAAEPVEASRHLKMAFARRLSDRARVVTSTWSTPE